MTSTFPSVLASAVAICAALGVVLGSGLAARSPSPPPELVAQWRSLPRSAPPLERGLWAHRGWRGEGAAENSAAAVQAAERAGFAGVELDVWWLDGLVVGHERRTARTGPALAEVVAGSGVSLWLDLKNLGEAPLEALVPALRASCAERSCWVESQDSDALVALGRGAPELGLVRWCVHPPSAQMLYGWPVEIDAMSVPVRRLRPELVALAAPLPVFTFTVDRPERAARLLEDGVAIVLTDELLPGGQP